MPLSVVAFTDQRAEVTVKTDLGDFAVRYRPNALTPLMERALAEAAGTDRFIDLFCELVEWVDLEGPLADAGDLDDAGNPRVVVAAGEPVPVTPECVELLPSQLLNLVLEAMQADMVDGAPKAARSTPRANRSRGGSFRPR